MGLKEHRYPSVAAYLPHAVAATGAMVLCPAAFVLLALVAMEPDPPMLALAALGVLTSLATIVAGTAIWMRRPDAAFIPFSDLMISRWLRRRRAEQQLAQGARLLGLDPTGQPIDRVHVSAEEQLRVLKDLTAALEAKDPYTHGHSRRVERHAYRTAAVMGLGDSDLEDVRKAAALHDVGKIRVSDRILRKDGPLTPEERAMIEEHSVVGAWMVSGVGNADVIAAVRHHHEHWDGSGYPDGIVGTDIPLFARIIAVADAYDAINSTRPYRASCGRQHAVDVLTAEAGRQFDPHVVECFLSALPTRLPVAAGLLVALAGPQRLMREVFAWFRRFGAGSLSPTVGAAGAAVVLGASVFTPNLPAEPPAPSAHELGQAQASDGEAGSLTFGSLVAQPARERAGSNARANKDAAVGSKQKRQRAATATETATGGPVQIASTGDGAEPTEGGVGAQVPPPPRVQDKPPTADEPEKPAPADEPRKPASRRRHTPPSDPRPDKGRDCRERSDQAQEAPGRSKHCD